MESKTEELQIHTYKHPMLRQKAIPLTLKEINQISSKKGEMHDIVEGMKSILSKTGVGLAAPQVGCSKRLFLYCPKKIGTGATELIINPVIETITDRNIVMCYEQCLSIPSVACLVPRPYGARVRFINSSGTQTTALIEGNETNIFLHEFDHLNGIWFVDRGLNRVKRREFKRYLKREVIRVGKTDRYLDQE